MTLTLIDPGFDHLSLAAFDEVIADRPIRELESLTPRQLKDIIVRCDLANVLVATGDGGQGGDLGTTLHILQHVAQRCPSIAMILCMHYHVVGTMAMVPEAFPFAGTLLPDVGRRNALVASAFAEGIPGRSIYTSTVTARIDGAHAVIRGSKKPCTMSGIADYFGVSVTAGNGDPGLALVPATSEGIVREPFWPSELLLAADSHHVRFDDVRIDAGHVLFGAPEQMQTVLALGTAAFNAMINAAYTGAALALANKVPARPRAEPALAIELHGRLLQSWLAMQALVPRIGDAASIGQTLDRMLLVRYRNQALLGEVVELVAEHVGSRAYLGDEEIGYLSRVCRLMSFHPINRTAYEHPAA